MTAMTSAMTMALHSYRNSHAAIPTWSEIKDIMPFSVEFDEVF